MNETIEAWLTQLNEKYSKDNQSLATYLEGLLYAKPITYWDYIEVDTLLSLQKPRTAYPDEMVFIIYHQITELFLKLIEHEVDQLTGDHTPNIDTYLTKLKRINRYTELLVDSFDTMRIGMDYEQYNKFRMSLAPASGFQSASFRRIEIKCTSLINLINEEGKKRIAHAAHDFDVLFDNLYWYDAGYNRRTGEKTLTLRLFEQRYLNEFKKTARQMQGKTLENKIMSFSPDHEKYQELVQLAKKMDEYYNVRWPLVHLRTAEYFLIGPQETKAATGGSDWIKYLHPKYQQRRFFPALWSPQEIEQWGENLS